MKELKDCLHFYLGCEVKYLMNGKGILSEISLDSKYGVLVSVKLNGSHKHIQTVISNIKLILRPLSDMTKEIEHNGNKFIPLKVLAGMAGTCSPGDWIIKSEYEVEHKTAKGCTFRISSSFDFIMKRSEKWKDFEVCAQQVLMFKKSIEWGFDLFNLIESGLAINKTTLK